MKIIKEIVCLTRNKSFDQTNYCLFNFQGKSTICYKFLDRTETPKGTLALEYLFGRRNKAIESVSSNIVVKILNK